jgi:hypothetical protein
MMYSSRPNVVRMRTRRRDRLDDDEADVVGDHVVELLRDAHAFLGDGAVGEQLALAVHSLGALAQRLQRRPAGGHVEAEGADRRALDREGGHLARRHRVAVDDRVERVAGDQQRHDDRRRAPGPRRGDRVEDHQDGQRRAAVGVRHDRPGGGRRQRHERPVPTDEDREDGNDGDRQEPRAVVVDGLGDRGADCRHREHRGERDVLRAAGGMSQPRGQGRGHAVSVSPAP